MESSSLAAPAPLCVTNPILESCSPVSLTLQGLEESRARLLHPVTSSVSWLAPQKPPDTQKQLWPGFLTKPCAVSVLDSERPSGVPLQRAASRYEESLRKEVKRGLAGPSQDVNTGEEEGTPRGGKEQSKLMTSLLPANGAKETRLFSAASEPAPSWLENSFLQQSTHCPHALVGLEESRARLLCPIATSAPWLASLKPLDAQFHFSSGCQEKIHASTSIGWAPDFWNEAPRPSSEVEQLQLNWEQDMVDLDEEMPEYLLTMLEDKLPEPTEEGDPSGEEVPTETREQEVNEHKLRLLNLICCSLVEGAKFEDPQNDLHVAVKLVCENLAECEPEFVLKAALYTRQELNIRSTANFLLVLASHLRPCRSHLRRYFCHVVQLPSDWIQVAKLYQTLAREGEALAPMPSCLRAAMTDKFRQFDAYQLAKYNTRKSRGKKRCRPKVKEGPRIPHSTNWVKHFTWFRKSLLFMYITLASRQKKYEASLKSGTEPSAARKNLFSLKALVRRLHICEPAQQVMGLLGCRYPSDLHSFSRTRLPGPWDSSLAGTRMRLPKPLTWDRELSEHGNKAAVWEKLIDAGKLPFMAMLRNLRNILQAGVSERHHRRLLKCLESKESVIRSKQLPFRFLAAYKVIQQLEKVLQESGQPIPSNTAIVKRILTHPSFQVPDSTHLTSRKLRCFFEVPYIFQLVKREKKRLLKVREVRFTAAILRRYCQALETAIHFAVRHNIPPIPGHTVILITSSESMRVPYMKAQDLCCPVFQQEDGSQRKDKPITKLEVAMLLGSMVYSASEQAQVFLIGRSKAVEPVAMTGSVLKDVQVLWQAAQKEEQEHVYDVSSNIIMDLFIRRQQVDMILTFGMFPETFRDSCLSLYRQHVAPHCRLVQVCSDARFKGFGTCGSGIDVEINGFSEQVLRFLAESSNSRLLEHVGKVDELHGLPKKKGVTTTKQQTGDVMLLPPTPKSRWRSVRIFISSTFRDMHGERDLLIRSVFPELRARAALNCLAIEDIDLRWGITEHEAQRNKQLELCLSEVTRSHLFIGILGERYGHVPKEYSLPDEPPYEWVKIYPRGRSITELEAVQFLNGCNDPAAASKAFFYLREPDFLGSVPEVHKADFAAESEEAVHRMRDLKEHLEKHEGLGSFSRYTCQWGGVARGRPYVKGLEEFGAKVLRDVWASLRRHFIEGNCSVLSDASEELEADVLQESFQELQQRRFCARAKLLHATAKQICGGRIYVVSGEAGQGKTVFLAALAKELGMKAPPHGAPVPSYHLVAHFTRAGPNQAEVQMVLGHLCASLRKLMEQPPEPATTYRALVAQFESLLHSVAQSLKRRQCLVVLIDGADLIHAATGQLVSDWLPEQLPQRVSLVLSVSEETSLLMSLKRRKDVIAVPLGPLDSLDRVAMVRKDLALYGKKLEESAFNNQMRLVLLKRGSRHPLYLTLLSQDLRLFALYEKLSERIQKLPVSLPLMLQHLLGCLEQDHGLELVAVALVALWASRDGLREQDLYAVLATWKEFNGAYETADRAAFFRQHARSYPMAPFSDFLRSLRGLLGACSSPSELPGSRLYLHGTPLRTAVERRYLKKPELARTAHALLAAHWYKLSDPDESRSFRNCEAESLMALPYHLVQSGHLSVLASLLTDLRFVRVHLRLRLLHCLSAAYALYEDAADSEHSETVDSFRDFLQRNTGLLSQNPGLFLQQAVNEPDSSSLSVQAKAVLVKNGRHFLKWINKPQKGQETHGSLVHTLPTTPSSVSVAPFGNLAAVGTIEGSLHILDTETGQELKSLLSACDGVSACTFLSETTVCLGSFNGRLELWSLKEGCRVMGRDAHVAQVTDCCINSDRKLLATTSLDGYLKLWETAQGLLMQECDNLCPLNCVTFHPKSQLVATGRWDRTVAVLNVNGMSVISDLKDHDSSVHSVSFSPDGNVLAAGSLSGSVRLWSWQKAVALCTLSAHSGCVSAARFLPGGKLLTAGKDSKVQLWKGHLGQLCTTLGSSALSPALCVALNLDCKRLAVGYHSDDVRVYGHPWRSDVNATHCRANGVAVCSLAWLDSLFLVGGSNDGCLCVWNTSELDPVCLRTLKGHEGAVTGLAVFKSLTASTSEDFTVRLWLSEQLRRGPAADASVSPLAILRGHTSGVTCCSFSPDGCYLATGGKDRSLFLWDVRDPSQKTFSLWCRLPFCHQDWISSCTWAGPMMLLSGSSDCTVCLWDPKTGRRLREFLGHQSPVCGVTNEKDHVISVDRDGVLVAWDLQGVEKTRFLAHPAKANQYTGFVEPGGKDFMVVVAGSDGTVNLLKPLVMEQPHLLSGHGAAVLGAAASPASSSFLTISEDNTVRVWAVPKEKAGGTKGHPAHRGTVTALAWSPNGEFAASGGERGDLVVWREARAVGSAKVGARCISTLVFTSSHTILVVSDGISLWDINDSRHSGGVVSLTHRKRLHSVEPTSVICAGMTKPGGFLVVGLTDGDFLVLEDGCDKFQNCREIDGYWCNSLYLNSDLSSSEKGLLHVWHSMTQPTLYKMAVLKSGRLKVVQSPYLQWEPKRPDTWVTVARLIKDELFYTDSEGALWTQTCRREGKEQVWELERWQRRKIHGNSITALHVLEGNKLITASHDRDVKMWDAGTMKLLSQFRCSAPVSQLQPCSALPVFMAGDTLGNVYFLEWACLHG